MVDEPPIVRKDLLDALTLAHDLLTTTPRWCSTHLALDATKQPVHPASLESVCWNAPGAILKAAALLQVDHRAMGLANTLLRAVTHDKWVMSPQQASAHTGRIQMVQALELSIALARP